MRLYYDISKLNNISEVFIDGFIFTKSFDNGEESEITLLGDYAECTDKGGRWKGMYFDETPDALNDNVMCLYQNIKSLLEAGYEVTNCIFAGNYDDDEDISFNIDGIELVVGNKFEEKRLYLLTNPITIQNH